MTRRRGRPPGSVEREPRFWLLAQIALRLGLVRRPAERQLELEAN